MGRALAGMDRRRLRLALAAFFLALAVPTAVLIGHAFSQLKWETFHQVQTLAEELAGRIDARLGALIAGEEARSFADYGFLVVAGSPSAGFLQRSPLSADPTESAIPGLVGYFQVDAAGDLSTPLLPAAGTSPATYGIAGEELDRRLALAGRIRQILGRNRLVEAPAAAGARTDAETKGKMAADRATQEGRGAPSPATSAPTGMASALRQVEAQAAFDRLSEAPQDAGGHKRPAPGVLGTVEDLNLDQRFARATSGKAQVSAAGAPTAGERAARKERSALPAPPAALPPAKLEAASAPPSPQLLVRVFESELDPFVLRLLDSGHLVFFRKVWWDGQRLVQGALIEQGPFLRDMVQAAFAETALSRLSDLVVAYRGGVLAAFTAQPGRDYLASAQALGGALLLRARLSAPASDLELVFSIRRLPAGPGTAVLGWVAATLVLVLCGGFLLMYRLGLKQIELARQQQDFVSAVSHELKTPLTSIRLYGEMLREGWATEEKKRSYYDFICAESERLGRLIENVLQLARLTRNERRIELRPMRVAELVAGVRPKLASLTERAGFALDLDCAAAAPAIVLVDPDFFAQILINLVDNAVKFSRHAERREVQLRCRGEAGAGVLFSVRDFGPGIPHDQMKKVFRLFYRAGNELTRETLGTGIGLALVRQLAQAMGGRVDLVNRGPGAELRLILPGQPATALAQPIPGSAAKEIAGCRSGTGRP